MGSASRTFPYRSCVPSGGRRRGSPGSPLRCARRSIPSREDPLPVRSSWSYWMGSVGSRSSDGVTDSAVAAASRWLEHASPITTVFPTTTSCALTSLSTGATPSVHGLVGYRQYLPRYGVVADMLKMSIVGSTGRDELVGPHWSPSLVSGCPSIFRRGMRATALSRDRFAGQGFTRILDRWRHVRRVLDAHGPRA